MNERRRRMKREGPPPSAEELAELRRERELIELMAAPGWKGEPDAEGSVMRPVTSRKRPKWRPFDAD